MISKEDTRVAMRKMGEYIDNEDIGDEVLDRMHNFMLAIKGSQEIVERHGAGTWKQYEYLLTVHLCTIYNPEKLKERIRELYFEADHENETPSLHTIAGIIDEENSCTIEEFYRSFSYSERDIDSIVALYNHHISSMMDIWVEEILQTWSYPYMGSAFGQYNFKEPNAFADNVQNILFPEFL